MSQVFDRSGLPIKVLIPKLPAASAIAPYLARIDASRVYSNYGPLSREFSASLSELTGAAGVTLTCNGTAAIELALRAKCRSEGGVCIMPAFTFIASAHAVCNAGLVPFLVEVDPSTLMVTPEIAEAALRQLDTPPAAVLVVSAFGAPPDFEGWMAFEAKHGISVVFDAAAAVTSVSGRVGAQPVCVSLHATKVLGIGEGGAILSADADFIEYATAMTGFGFLGSERSSAIRGGNYRISEYAAAVGLAALEALPTRLEGLRSLIEAYATRLKNKEARLQPGAGHEWITMTLNVILPEDSVVSTLDRLAAAGVEWRRWWGFGCHRHPAFANVPRADLSATNSLANCVIGLPFHEDLSVADIDRVVACLP